jgi:hypothetical protein
MIVQPRSLVNRFPSRSPAAGREPPQLAKPLLAVTALRRGICIQTAIRKRTFVQ